MSQSSLNADFELLDRDRIADLWHSRFGMPPDAFQAFSFYRKARMIWMFSEEMLPPFRLETAGLRIMSMKKGPWKPTTYALQLLGRYATKNVVSLDEDGARMFIAGGTFEMEADLEEGYVIATFEGQVLGCALYSRGRLISQLPKERRRPEDP